MKKTLKRLLAVGVSAVMVLAMTACGGTTATSGQAPASTAGAGSGKADPTGEKVINRAIIGAPGSMNPLVDAGGAQFIVLEAVFDRPFDADGVTGDVYPRLCDSYETNEDSTVYTVHINKDAKWHDGEDVTADDFVWTYQMYTDPEVATSHATKLSMLQGVDPATGLRVEGEEFGVVALDEDTVQFTLTRSTLPTELFSVYLYIFPEHVYGAVPANTLLTTDLWTTPVGSSYLKLDSYVDGSVYEFTANKEYHLGAPDFDRLVVKCMEQTNILGALMSGEVDMAIGHANRGDLPIADVELASQQSNLTLEAGGGTIQYLTINNQRYDENFRKAVNMAIDKQMIVDSVYQGYAELLTQMVPPSNMYYDDSQPVFERDVEGAKVLLAQSSFDTSQTLEMLIGNGRTDDQQIAVIIQQNLAEIGINVEITSMDYATVLDTYRTGDFDMGMAGTGYGAEWFQIRQNLQVGSATNFSNTTDSTLYDLAIEAQNHIDDQQARREIYNEMQQYWLDTMPQVFLANKQSVFCYNNEVVTECDLSNAGGIIWRMWEWKFNK